jgi:purine nucleoside permease
MGFIDEDGHEVSSIDGRSSAIERQWKQGRPEANDPEQPQQKTDRVSLSRTEIWNVTFCLLAWAFAVCNVTLGE